MKEDTLDILLNHLTFFIKCWLEAVSLKITRNLRLSNNFIERAIFRFFEYDTFYL